MSDERRPVLTYAGADDGRYRSGVPRRDLFEADVLRLPPAVLKEITGGEHPLYTPAGVGARTKAAKAAAREPEAAEAPPTGGEE